MSPTANKTEHGTQFEKTSRIVSALQRQIADGNKDRAEQQIGCHNDNSGGGHNDN